MSRSQEDALRILQWNAGGFSQPKRLELLQTLYEKEIDVFAIMEANLTEDSLKYYPFKGYSLYVLAKSRQVASGILVGVKRDLTADFRIIKAMGSSNDRSEVVHLDVWKRGVHFKILAIYSPPGNSPDFTYVNHLSHCIFIGDFNAHSPNWGYSDTNEAGRRVQDFLNSTTFELIYDHADPHTYLHYNGKSFTPDLLLATSDLFNITKRTVLKDPSSGHRQVLAEVEIPRASQKPLSSSKISWNFKKANWPLFTDLLEHDLSPDNFNFTQDPNKVYKIIKNAIIACAKQTIPRGRIRKYRSFWTDELTILKAKRDRLRRKAELTTRSCDVIAWRKQSALFRKTLINSKRSCFREFISKIDYKTDSKKTFNYIGNLMNGSADSPKQSFSVNGRGLSSDSAVAKAFAQHFCGAHVKNKYAKSNSTKFKREIAIQQSNSKSEFGHPSDNLFEAPITREELAYALRNIPIGKSPGIDRIQPEFLLHLGPRAFETLWMFYNLTWSTGVIPVDWKASIVIPIQKKGKEPNDLHNYRPISLTSVAGKIMEKIVVRRLNFYLESNGLLAEEQAGFRCFRSTNQHVALLSQSIKDALDNKQVLTAIFIDLKSAYDKVWREYLLLKLSKLGVRAKLFNWIRDFLCQRSCRVRYGRALSKSKLLRTGLPQGAVSSCSLFNIYINDLILNLRKLQGIRCLLYADDLVVWTVSKKKNVKISTENNLSAALKVLEVWCETNNMEVNLNKSFYLSFSLTHQPVDLQLKYKGSDIPYSNEIKYLGATFDRKLTWKAHVEDISNRASRRLSALKRLAGAKWGCCGSTLLQTFRSFIRPLLTYCCEPLIVAGENVVNSLEKIQNQALRIVTGAVKTTPIDAMYMYTDDRPLRTIFQEKAVLLWEKIIRIPGCISLWQEANRDATRNLKNQLGFLQGVLQLQDTIGLNYEPEHLISPQDPLIITSVHLKLDLCQFVTKSNTDPTTLRTLALEVLGIFYPEPQWLRIFTDGSLLTDSPNAGAGVFSEIFSFYHSVGCGTAFDGEIAAIRTALSQLLCHLENFTKAVILSDSRAALLAIASFNDPLTQDVLACRNHLQSLAFYEKNIVLQWVPAHCGVPGNEKADHLAKKGASINQRIIRPVPFSYIKILVKAAFKALFKEDLTNRTLQKPWRNSMGNLCRAPRRRAVADFRLTIGHDCLRNHLFRFNIVPSPFCTLCVSGEVMDADHLHRCSALRKSTLTERYWEARDLLD